MQICSQPHSFMIKIVWPFCRRKLRSPALHQASTSSSCKPTLRRWQTDSRVLKFDTANHNVTGKKKDWRHYQGQCDYFAIYSADLGKVYLVPVDDVGTTKAHLRLEPSKNRQEKNVR